MNQIRLDRSPSISSCFPERFSGVSVEKVQAATHQCCSTSQLSHKLPLPPNSLPRSPVDKHLIVEEQVLPKIHPNLVPGGPNPSSQYDTESWPHSKPTSRPLPGLLPAPPPCMPNFLKARNSTQVTLYLPLYQAAMKGDWRKADEFLKSHPGAINVRITKEMDTVLHIASGAKHTKFVEEVVKRMQITDLASRNKYNNTALCYAAASGVTKIAEVMVGKNRNLPLIRNDKGVTPLYIAALFGHRDMVWYLYSVTSDDDLTMEDYVGLLTATINTNLFDIALNIIQHRPELAIHRDPNGETALHVLARKPSAFLSKSKLGTWERFIYPWIYVQAPSKSSWAYGVFKTSRQPSNKVVPSMSTDSVSSVRKLFLAMQIRVPGIKEVYEKKSIHVQTLELLKLLWEQVLLLEDPQIESLLARPSQPLFVAAEFGILEFVTVLIGSYPDFVWKVNNQGRNIFHIAVRHREENIFNLIHDIGAHKDIFTAYKDANNRNMLHLAGIIAPMDRLNTVSGAALQMQRELLWFKEVEKSVQPFLLEMRDENGQTPRMLFTEEHRGLVKEGEKWLKSTASSCMLVATLITTVMFAAIFTVPGGNDNSDGTPIFLQSKAFMIFSIADASALFSSVTSILMFLSILTSRYAEEDFLESLPKRLVVGLATLFWSIASMLVSFGATFCIVLGQRLAWIVVPVALSSSIPVTLFAFLQFPLLADMIHSSYGAGIFARKCTEMLY